MSLKNPIVINNFQKGIATSPFVGFSSMVNMYVGNSGAISQAPSGSYNTYDPAIDGLVRWAYGNYQLTSHGKLYLSGTLITGNTLDAGTEMSGCGLAVYGDYVYVARNAKLDRYQISTTTWTNNWQNLNSYDFHQIIVGQDDILYICNGNTIASYNGTTWNASALTLPIGNISRCMTELGSNLYIGTYGSGNIANIYPWDRTSNVFNLPIIINESGVYQMTTKNNIIYAVCGVKATLYSTVGTVANKLVSFSDYIRGTSNQLSTYSLIVVEEEIHPAAIAGIENEILVGLPYTPNFYRNGEYPFGVWSYNLSTGAVVLKNVISTNPSFTTNAFEIGCLKTGFSSYDIFWRTGYHTGSIVTGQDTVSLSSPIFNTSSYRDYFESALYMVGNIDNQNTFNRINIILSKLLINGQGLQIKYRKTLTDSWTTLATIDYTLIGAKHSYSIPFAVTSDTIQIRVEFKGTSVYDEGGTGTTVYYSPELLSLTLI